MIVGARWGWQGLLRARRRGAGWPLRRLARLHALPLLLVVAGLSGAAAPVAAQQAPAKDAAASAAAASPLAPAARFAPAVEGPAIPGLPWLFNAKDRAAAAATPRLRVAVPSAGVPALVAVTAGGNVQGPLVQWLQAVAAALGLQVSPLLVADENAQLQALRDGRADLALAVSTPMAGPGPGLAYSLGTGGQPLAWVVLRELRPVPLERARIAHVASGPAAEAVTSDRLRRHHPDATLLPQGSVEQALQAVVEQRADAYLGNLLPVLAVLQSHELQGLELRQVWPGAAGHRHLVLREDAAALLPALNKALAAWRGSNAPHQAVLRVAQQAALGLRAPLALPADLMGADTAVMDRLIKPPYGLSGTATEHEPLAQSSTWRVGALRTPVGPVAALSALDAQGQHTGSAADMLQEVALRLGVVVQMRAFDSDAAMLEALRSGAIDAVPLLEHTPQLSAGLMLSLPWLELPQVLVGTDSGPLFWGLESLRGRRLAIAADHPLRAELQRQHPGIQWVDAADGTAALALLRQGQADAAMDIKPVVQRLLATPAGQGLRVLGDVAEFTARYRVGLSEAQRGLMPQLDAALTDIEAEERQRSVRRWLVTEPVPARSWWQSPRWMASLAAGAAALAAWAGWGWWRASRRRAAAQAQEWAASGLAEPLASVPPARSEPALEQATAAPPDEFAAAAPTKHHPPPPRLQPVGGVGRRAPAGRHARAAPAATTADEAAPEGPPGRAAATRAARPARPMPALQPAAAPEPAPVPVDAPLQGLQPAGPTSTIAPVALPLEVPPAQALQPQPLGALEGRAMSLFERAVAAGLPAMPVRTGPDAADGPATPEAQADDQAFESIDVEAAWKADGRFGALGLPATPSGLPAATVADSSQDLHLERLLEQVLVPHHRQAVALGPRLTWSLDEVLPVRIRSDPGRLTVLINELLSRALALATPLGGEGRVVFKATWARLDGGKPALQLTVNATTKAVADPGAPDVRLSRAAELVTALQGQLALRQREGVGQAVVVRVPLRGARNSASGAASA